jgi:hypothetical protein
MYVNSASRHSGAFQNVGKKKEWLEKKRKKTKILGNSKH